MSVVPAASFVLGNFQYDSHAREVGATLGVLPCVNRFRVRLPARARMEAAPGDPASLELDGGEGARTVLTGTIAAVERAFLTTEVVAADGGAALAALRPAATYEKQAAKDVIRALASDAGVDVGAIDVDLPLAAYVGHQARTAAEHVAELARLGGAMAHFDADGRLDVGRPPEGPADLALLYGREIVEARQRVRRAPAARRVAIGNGPAGSTSAPDALRQSLGRLPGDASAPGAGAVWRAQAVLRTPEAALTASQAAETVEAARTSIITCRCVLLPGLRPGMAVEIQELPNGLSAGPWLITRVQHRLHPLEGGTTVFEARNAGRDLLGDLLGALGSSPGGLL
jgi:prophage tail gpP-like protein